MSLLSGVLSLRSFIDQKFHRTLSSYSMLETTAGKYWIAAKDGSMLSVIRIDGTRVMTGPDDLESMLNSMALTCGNYLEDSNYDFEIYIERDPEAARGLIGGLYSDARRVMERIGLDLEGLIQAREKYLSKLIVDERVYLTLWTRPSVLSPKELRNIGIDTQAPDWWPADSDAQAVYLAAQKMVDRHSSFVDTICADLSEAGIRLKLLDVTTGLRAIRRAVDREGTADDWCPSTPWQTAEELSEDEIAKDVSARFEASSIGRGTANEDDVTGLLWPRLDEQLFARPAECLPPNNPQNLKIGSYIYAGMDLTAGPRELQTFNRLIRRMRMGGKEFPWRVKFLMRGGGLGRLGFRRTLAAICQITNPENKLIKDAIDELKSRYLSKENVLSASIHVSFSTWARIGQERQLEEQLSRLQSVVEGWGHCEVSTSIGDPLAGFMSSCFGLSTASTAPFGVGPVKEILKLQPWQRDSSPYEKGPVIFRTPDGRAWPFDISGNITTSDFHLIVGSSGGGKSVLLNTFNLGACLSPGQTAGVGGFKLPRIALIDYGPTSKGLINLIRENLPPGQEYLAVYRRLRYDEKNVINPCDTPLGSRKPPSHQRSMLVNLICQLATDASSGRTPEALTGMVSMIVDELYENKSDRTRTGAPKLYSKGDYIVDDAIQTHKMPISGDTTWWDVVDYMAQSVKEYHIATRAQRYAVPMLADLLYVANMSQIKDLYGETLTDTGEPLLSSFKRVISEALRDYKIFSRPSTFDLGSARIISLDIDECCGDSSTPQGRKQTSIACLLARFAIAGDFYLIKDNISEFETDYQDYHEQRIQRLNETKKILGIDEMHKTKGCPGPRNQIVMDGRVGRKFGVIVIAATQMADDFDKEMVNLASSIWITGTRNASETKAIAGNADLSQFAEEVINKMGGPTKRGGPVFTNIKTRFGKHEHFLYNSLGPQELWALQTSPRNALLRDLLAEKVGYKNSWEMLAKIFPEGSAQEIIDKRINAALELGNAKNDEEKAGVVALMAEELAKRYYVSSAA